MSDSDYPEAAPADPTSNAPAYSVSELAFALKRTLENAYGFVRLRAELSKVTHHSNGHVYLTLKDDKASLDGVVWKGNVRALSVRPEQGLEVIVTGKITTYPAGSRYQIVIDSMEAAGIGALLAQLERLKARLTEEGLFEAGRKRRPPFAPAVIGVVTSPTGAVIRDILHRIRDRWPAHVLVWPVVVQGDQAAAAVTAAIAGFNALPPGGAVPRPDVLIVARGGGSVEDLWPFNDEGLARAVAASTIPLISAVGHETDTTLADFVADLRAPTPSAAAAQVMPERRELEETLARYRGRLEHALVSRVERMRGRLVSADKVLADPRRLVTERQLRLETLARRAREAMRSQPLARRHRLERLRTRLGARAPSTEAKVRAVETLGRRILHAFERRLAGVRHDVAASAARLDALSPLAVLGRGFTLARKPDGRVVRDAAEIAPGDRLALRFARGEAEVEVLETSPDGGPAADPPRR